MTDYCMSSLLRRSYHSELSFYNGIHVFLFGLLIYILFRVHRWKSTERERFDWPYVKLDQMRCSRDKQNIEEIGLDKLPASIETIFEVLESKFSKIMWINEDTFISMNGWSIKRLMEAPELHRMLALDFTCSRRNGPWKRLHVYSRSSQSAVEAVLALMAFEHKFNTVDICYHRDISDPEIPLDISAFTPEFIRLLFEMSLNRHIEIGFEGLCFTPEQSEALARYSFSLNLGHNTTADGVALINALRKRDQPLHSLSLRERPFDDVNWSHLLSQLAECRTTLVHSVTLFHGCFVGSHECPLLVKARVERLTVHSACFHDDGEALVEAVAQGKCPPHLHLIGYQPEIFVRTVQSLSENSCTLKSLWISLSGPQHASHLHHALQIALAKNRSLEALTIDNVVDVGEWVATFAPLISNPTLCKLSLNHIETTSLEAARAIVQILESNRKLEILYGFSESPRRQCRDAWEKTIENTQRYNRFLRNATPFVSNNGHHFREALFNEALARNRHDSRRMSILLSQNADLLVNVKPAIDSAQNNHIWYGYKIKLARFYETQRQNISRWIHAFQEYTHKRADDLGHRLTDALICSNLEWHRDQENPL
jgi:hypothetical protein